MPKRKIARLIVEGISEKVSLGVLLSALMLPTDVQVEVIGGDITSQNGINTSNVKSKIGTIVNRFLKTYRIKKTDVDQVIHVVDTDGAFVDSSCIKKDVSISKTVYFDDEIHTATPENIILRNDKKSDILRMLCTTDTVCGSIKYSVWYMSCNLDHVLHYEANMENEKKEDMAFRFAEKYEKDIIGFVLFFNNKDLCKCSDYDESWRFIQENCNSLHRNSNFGLFLSRYT